MLASAQHEGPDSPRGVDLILVVEDLTYRLTHSRIVPLMTYTPAQLTADPGDNWVWGCAGFNLYYIPAVTDEKLISQLDTLGGKEYYRGTPLWGPQWRDEDGNPLGLLPHNILDLVAFPQRVLVNSSLTVERPVKLYRLLRRFIVKDI